MIDNYKDIKLGTVLLLFIVILLVSSTIYIYFNSRSNLNFKRQIACQEIDKDYYYSKELDSCISSDNNQLGLSQLNKLDFGNQKQYLCNFSVDLNKQEKVHIDNKTYFELEGIVISQGDEHLELIGAEVRTIDNKRRLLGWGKTEIGKDVELGEEVPFSISVLVDRDKEDVNNFFSKEDDVLISIHPVYSTCR